MYIRPAVLALVFTISAAGLGQAQEFEEYVNTRDGFKIAFPGQPRSEEHTSELQSH